MEDISYQHDLEWGDEDDVEVSRDSADMVVLMSNSFIISLHHFRVAS